MSAVAPILVVSAGLSPRRVPAALGYAGVVTLAALAGGVAAGGNETDPTAVGLARAVIVGIPLAVGFHAWHSRRAGRFGALLMVLGVAWFMATFAEADQGGWYLLGRVAGWTVEVLFVYVALAFPRGRLTERVDRLLVGAMALVVLMLFLPQVLLAEHLAVPSPYTSCTGDCPANVLFVLDSEPTSLLGALRSAGALLVFTIEVGVVARLWLRIGGARSMTGRALVPVAVVVGARAALLGVAIVAREVGPDQQGLEAVAWILAFATPALAVAFAVGIVRFQLFAGRVLQHLAAHASATPDAIDLERTLARAFADPALQLAFQQPGTPGGWAGPSGRPLVLPGPRSGRCGFEVPDRHGPAAVIVGDEDLQLQPELTDAAASLVAMTLQNQRLEAGAAVSLRELEASRERLATSAERERRRIERDLHDGAQQRLVALRIELELAEDLLEHDPAAGKLRLKQLEHDVDDALEELRALAHGVYPPVLADRGLAEALRAVAARSPVRVEIEALAVGRYAPELESAVYYAVLEALQNALKHAKGVRRVIVGLDGAAPGALRFSVRDDGAGIRQGAALGGGAGITSMRDRVSAFGGRLDITSAVGVGTTVRGVVRVDAKAAN